MPLLKILHILDIDLGEIELELSCKPPSQGLALVVPEDAMKLPKKKRNQQSYPAIKLMNLSDTFLTRYPHGTIRAQGHFITGMTNICLIELKVYSTGGNAHPVL